MEKKVMKFCFDFVLFCCLIGICKQTATRQIQTGMADELNFCLKLHFKSFNFQTSYSYLNLNTLTLVEIEDRVIIHATTAQLSYSKPKHIRIFEFGGLCKAVVLFYDFTRVLDDPFFRICDPIPILLLKRDLRFDLILSPS